MDEKNILKLRVLEKTQQMINDAAEEKAVQKFVHPNQTNPLAKDLYKKMAMFHNSKIGEKFSIKDLLR